MSMNGDDAFRGRMKENWLASAEHLMIEYSAIFKSLHEGGESLVDEPSERYMNSAAVALMACSYTARNGSFITRWSARRIKKQIEFALMQAEMLKKVVRRFEGVAEAERCRFLLLD